MAVPTVITDLNVVIASNVPAGSENVFPNLDDYIRALSAFIAQLNANKAALAGAVFTGAVSGITDLTTTGNTILGNAATDTLNIGANGIIKDNANNVGIGTAPAARFDVAGVSASTPGRHILTDDGSFIPHYSQYKWSGSGANYHGGRVTMGGVGEMILQRATAAALGAHSWVETMRLDASGNVGVGTGGGLTRKFAVGGSVAILDSSLTSIIDVSIDVAGAASFAPFNNATGSSIYFGTNTAGSGTTAKVAIDGAGNMGLGASAFGASAAKVLGLANATAPSTSPAGMGQLYVEGGSLKFRGSAGTVTVVAPA